MIKLSHMKSFVSQSWLRLLGIVMIVVAVTSYFSGWYTLPYAFYQLMCWVVVIESLLIVLQTYKDKGSQVVLWIFVLTAIVFNPITPVYMTTLIWQYVDIAAGVLFVLSFFFLEKN
jgi:hypothetical protein